MGTLLEIPEPRPDEWNDVARLVLKRTPKRRLVKVMVMGPIDSGKSTLSLFLFRAALLAGFGACYLDLDVGQSTVGLPLTLSSLCASSDEHLKKRLNEAGEGFALPDLWDFVPSNSPRGVVPHFLTSTFNLYSLLMRRLDRALRQKPYVLIVDTTGYLGTLEALHLKLLKLRLIRPDVLVLLSPEPESYPREHRNLSFIARVSRRYKVLVMALKRSPYVKPRDREHRASYRASKLKLYFEENCDYLELPVSSLMLPPYGSGYSLSSLRSLLREGAVLVGVYDKYRFIGLGALKELNSDVLKLVAPQVEPETASLMPSDLMLMPDYSTYKLRHYRGWNRERLEGALELNRTPTEGKDDEEEEAASEYRASSSEQNS